MSELVARLPVDRLAAAMRQRTAIDLEAARTDRTVWIRPTRSAILDADALRERLPSATLFHLKSRRLIPLGAELPVATLPELDWRPLAELLPVSPPIPRPVAASPPAAAVTLVPSLQPLEPDGLLTTIAALAELLETAIATPYEAVRFAADGETAIVVGSPLPPVEGTRLVIVDGLAIPAGFRLHPPVAAASLRELTAADESDLLLWQSDGVDRITADSLVPLTRANLRATRDAVSS